MPSLMCDFVTGILMTYILTQLPTGSESLRLGVKFGTFHMSQSHGIFQISFGFSLWCFSCLHLTIAGHEFFDIIYNTFIVMWYQRAKRRGETCLIPQVHLNSSKDFVLTTLTPSHPTPPFNAQKILSILSILKKYM